MQTVVTTSRPAGFGAFLNPAGMVRDLWSHRRLAVELARREIRQRYRAHALGMVWTLLTPLAMLAIYTFLFAVVFQARWRSDGTVGDVALQIFAGLIVFQLFRELVGRAPGLVVGHPNYVKRVVFPLQVLPVCDLFTAAFGFGINLLVWLVGWALVERAVPHAAMVTVPVLVLPAALAGIGIAWVLASLGVFLRDVANLTDLALTMLFFLTPVFYNIERIPEPYRGVVGANPIAQTITTVRGAMLDGAWPDPVPWLLHTGIGALIALLGYAFFMKSRRAFADVL